MRRLVPAIAALTLAACNGGGNDVPATPPAPADPTDPASIVEAARACNPADFAHVPPATNGRPEFHGDPDTAQRNALESELYLERMRLQPCVYELPSGLMISVTRATEGDSPVRGDMVTVNYEGWLADGTVFDSSYARGEPATFPSDRLIAGWVEALPLMRTGEEWTLYIPAGLAYGSRGAGSVIGPEQALTFRLELLELPGRE